MASRVFRWTAQPEALAAAFTWAAERARAGQGPTLIEVIAMRMCGHAHHDDMLFWARTRSRRGGYHVLHDGGYANKELYDFWSKRDPLPRYAAKLESEGVTINQTELNRIKAWARELVEVKAPAVIAMPWPKAEMAGIGVFANEAPAPGSRV